MRRKHTPLGELGPMARVRSIVEELEHASGSMRMAERTATAAGLPKLAGHFRTIRDTVDAMREEMLHRLQEGGTRSSTMKT